MVNNVIIGISISVLFAGVVALVRYFNSISDDRFGKPEGKSPSLQVIYVEPTMEFITLQKGLTVRTRKLEDVITLLEEIEDDVGDS